MNYHEMSLSMSKIIDMASDMGAVYMGSYLAEDKDYEVDLGVPHDEDLSKIHEIMNILQERFGGEIKESFYDDSTVPPKSRSGLQVRV